MRAAAINNFFINKSSSLDKGAPSYFLRERTIILVSEAEMVSNCLKPQRVCCGGVERTLGATTRKLSDSCGVVWVSMVLLIVLWVPYVRGDDLTILFIGVLFIVLEIFSNYVRFVQKIWLND